MIPALLLLFAQTHLAQDTCGSAVLRPGYSHNDYYSERPLVGAIEAGLQGVEVDLYRAGSDLLVGHSRSELDGSRTLDKLYLQPMAERIKRCGNLVPGTGPFLLNLELKESDARAFALLAAALDEHWSLLERGRVLPVLVGWWPEEVAHWPPLLRTQLVFEDRPLRVLATAGPPIGLVSVDYSRSLNWDGNGQPPSKAAAALAEARSLATQLRVLLRVHQVPPRASIYRWLLESGVDLIGFKSLDEVRVLEPAG
jgi:hypothetical protein